MLPPPTTTATSTPSLAVWAISLATCVRTSGLMPYPCCPISASPEILRRTRLYAGLAIAATLAPRRVVGNRPGPGLAVDERAPTLGLRRGWRGLHRAAQDPERRDH